MTTPSSVATAEAQRTSTGAVVARKIRILVVDDSVVIRRFLSTALGQEPTFEIIGFAGNGLLALQKAAELKPDVITLDIEMPEMDGLTTIRKLREQGSKAYVIMCSTLTSRGASAAIDALMLGANDYVTKPSNSGPMDAALKMLQDELIPKIKQFFVKHQPAVAAARAASPAAASTAAVRRPAMPLFSTGERKVVAIGVSTGGPTALMEIMPQFPASFPLPVVIVQHMPPIFTKLLAERLRAQSSFEVVEATEGMTLAPGRVVIAAGDYHMRLKRSEKEVKVTMDQGPRENSCRPAVDVLFRSVGDVYAGSVIGVILTGMGQDGLRGVEHLKDKGAYIIAQDQKSSVVWGMPGAVVEAGLADVVVGLNAVVPEILRQVSR